MVVYETPCQGRQLQNLAASPYAAAVDCEQSALSAYSIESMVESPLDGEPRLHWMERWGLHPMEVYRSIVGVLAVVIDGRKRHSRIA